MFCIKTEIVVPRFARSAALAVILLMPAYQAVAANIANCNFPPNSSPFVISSADTCDYMNIATGQSGLNISNAGIINPNRMGFAISNDGSIDLLTNTGSIKSGFNNVNTTNRFDNYGSLDATYYNSIVNFNYFGQINNYGSISSSHEWAVVNRGYIQSIVNTYGATISSENSAIDDFHYPASGSTIGQIINDGTISSSSSPVVYTYQSHIGSIINNTTGIISGPISSYYYSTIDEIRNSGNIGGYIEASNNSNITNIINSSSGTINGNINNYSSSTIDSITNTGQINGSITNYSSIGTVTNNSTGSVTSAGYAIYNYGDIQHITNKSGAVISGGSAAIFNSGTIGSIYNAGNLNSQEVYSSPIRNSYGNIGDIINTSTGVIDGHGPFIENSNQSTINLINNSGSISGSIENKGGSGINSITNQSSGAISGIWNSGLSRIGTITNYGSLTFIGNEIWGGPGGSTINRIDNYGVLQGIQNLYEIGAVNLYGSAQMGDIRSCGSIGSITVNDKAQLSRAYLSNGGCGWGQYYPQNTATIQSITVAENAAIVGGIGNDGGIINSITNQGMISIIGNNIGVGGDVATIGSLANSASGTINGIQNKAHIASIQNSGVINGVNNTGIITLLQNNGVINNNAASGYYAAITSTGNINNLINNGLIYANYGRSIEFINSGASSNVINNGVIDGGITILTNMNSTFINNGVIRPYNVPHNFSGTFTQSSSGSIEVGLFPGILSQISVNGSASLAGTLIVRGEAIAPAYLPSTKYTILTATKGVTGRFDSVSNNIPMGFSFLAPSLLYGSNDVTLGFQLTPFSVVGRTINQRNVGNALTIGAFGPISGPGANILNTLFYGSYQSAQSVMDTVGGAGLAGVQTTAMEVGQMASSTVSDQIAFWRSGETSDATGVTLHEGGSDRARSFMAYAPTETGVTTKTPIMVKGPVAGLVSPIPPVRTFRAWGSMFGGGANFLSDSSRGTPAANAGYYGGLLGVDYQLAHNALVGVSLGGSSAGFSVGSLSTTGKLTGFHAGIYGAYSIGASYIALNETFSAYSNQTNRSAGGYSFLPYESLTANFGSTEFRTRVEGGHSLRMGGLNATPFVAAEVAAYNTNGFSERSSLFYQSSLALKNNGQAINSLPTFVGLRLSNAYTLENGWRLAPIGSLAYVHEFYPQRQFTNILMSMPGQDFNVAGPRSTYNLVQTKIGAQLNLTNQLALFTDFQGEFSPMSQSYGGKAGARYSW